MQARLLIPVVWIVALHLSALAIGRPIHDRMIRSSPDDRDPCLEILFSILLGFAVLFGLIFSLGVVGLLHAPLLVVLVVLLAAIGLVGLLRRPPRLAFRLGWRDAPLALAWLFAASFVLAALDPVLTHDDNTYHLLIPRTYLDAHRIVWMPLNVYANMPHAVEMLYVPAMAIGDYTAPKVLVFSFHFLTLAGLASFGLRRLGRVETGILALLYVSGKNVQMHLGLAGIEPVIGYFLLCAVLALLAWTRTREPGYLWIVAVGCGLAAGSKYPAGPYALVIVLAAAYAISRAGLGRKTCARLAAGLVLVSGGLFAPWLVKNALLTGNPLYPGFYGLFGGKHWSRIQEFHVQGSMAAAGGDQSGVLEAFAVPFKLVLRDGYFCPNFSIALMGLFLLAPLLPSSWKNGRGLLQCLSIAGFLTWVFGIRQGRFLVAWMPVMVLSAGAALRLLRGNGIALAATAAAVLGLGVFQLLEQKYAYDPHLTVLSEPREERVERNANHALCERLNGTLPPEAKLLCLWDNQFFFLERPFCADGSYEAPAGLAWLREKDDAAAFARELRSQGFTHVLINHRIAAIFLEEKLSFPMFDAEIYPREQLARDRQLLERFVREELEPIHQEGRTTVYALRPEAGR